MERFHRFLNKAQTIASNDHDTVEVFAEASITAAYPWNSAPNDGTDIIRSIPTIGRELRFMLDIELQDLATLTANNANSTLEYLLLNHTDRSFATSILQILIEDRRVKHAERINNNRNIITYKAGDLVMTRTEVQSDAKYGRVGKLSYQVSGPFRIIRYPDHGSYFV